MNTENFDKEKFLVEFENLQKEVDRYRDKLYEEERYLKERQKPLPDKLYHITTRQNADQIMRGGLDPSKLIFENRDVVSLSDDIPFAMRLVQETQKTNFDDSVIFEINTKNLNHSFVENYLREANPDNPNPIEASAIHEVHYGAAVPPEAIRIKSKRKFKYLKNKTPQV